MPGSSGAGDRVQGTCVPARMNLDSPVSVKFKRKLFGGKGYMYKSEFAVHPEGPRD